MINFTDRELHRRLTTLHPEARRRLAAMTDSTYRGPHNITKPASPVRVHLSKHLVAAEIGCFAALALIILERLL